MTNYQRNYMNETVYTLKTNFMAYRIDQQLFSLSRELEVTSRFTTMYRKMIHQLVLICLLAKAVQSATIKNKELSEWKFIILQSFLTVIKKILNRFKFSQQIFICSLTINYS